MELLFKDVFNLYSTDIYLPYNNINSVDKSEWCHDVNLKDFDSYIKNYGNPCSKLNHIRFTVVLERNEEKICLKIFYLEKNRRLSKKFFKKTTRIQFITYRIKDSAVFYGSVDNYHRKRGSSKYLRRFVFGQKDIVMDMVRELRYIHGRKEVVDEINLIKDVESPVKKFIEIISEGKGSDSETLYKFILEKQGVKYPNNVMSFVDSQSPTVNKKNRETFGGKYIDAFMSLRGYKGKKIKRVLHSVNSFNSQAFNNLIDFFGLSYVLDTSTDEELRDIFQYKDLNNFLVRKPFKSNFNRIEKLNIFKICLLGVKGSLDSISIMDHLNFHSRINKFEKCKWLSKDVNGFMSEHILWSDKVSSYDNGDFNRVYSKNFIIGVENIIKGDKTKFLPVVLKNSEEYNEESIIQSNCVRTYVKRPESLIISLRDVGNSDERVTIEYRIKFDGKILELNRVQSLGRFNSRLDDYWNYPIKLLDDRIYNMVKDGLFTDLGVEVNFNNVKIKSGYKVNEVTISKVLPMNNDVSITNYKIEWEYDEKINAIGYKSNEFNIYVNDIDMAF